NLGLLKYELNDLAGAAALCVSARSHAVQAFEEPNVRVGEIDVNLGWIALETGDATRAESKFREALTAFGQTYGAGHHRTAECEGYLARVLAMRGQEQNARQLLEQALAAREAYL